MTGLPAHTRVLATQLDNGREWIEFDEAAANQGLVHVPLPLFFTAAQRLHALRAAGVDTLITPQGIQRLGFDPVSLPANTAKVTFTSGTTGAPKGVCLSASAMNTVADSLLTAMAPLAITRHLNALPLAVLLENIAGLLAPHRHGITVITLPLAEVGLTGSSSFNPALLDAAVRTHAIESLILLPQMLRAWVTWLRQTKGVSPATLKLVAVGGAAVGAALVQAAWSVGLPVAEGYGLSEGASVQTLNLPGAQRVGSVGRPLPHAQMRVADDGEIQITGSLFNGYLGEPVLNPHWWPTGDLGRIDGDGFVWVDGRKSNLLITSYGRNVSPEWVESALQDQPEVELAVVFGDGQPTLSAVLWPSHPDVNLDAAVAAANAQLPDYARIGHWTQARAAFNADTGLSTPNGRPRRAAILALHASHLQLESRCP